MFLLIEDALDGTTFADRLAAAMEEAGINGRALAAAVGVKESSVSQWLSSKIKGLSGNHLFAVADVLGVEPRWLLTGHGPRTPRIPPDLAALTDQQIAAILSLIKR